MPASTRLGDQGSGHACHFPPTSSIAGSPNVNVNGIKAVRKGDAYAPHGCGPCKVPPHPRALAAGSGSVYINGMPAGRVGDAINCGGNASKGSSDVFIGG